MEEVDEAPKTRRKAGRPRKWVDDAERARAYRRRRAEELAAPDRLRRERRELRRQLAEVTSEVETERRRREAAELDLARVRAELAAVEQDLEQATLRQPPQTPPPTPPVPAAEVRQQSLNRAQRGAEAKRQRRRR